MKFAKYNPEPIENDTTFSASWDFVSATREEDHVEVATDVNVNEGGKSV